MARCLLTVRVRVWQAVMVSECLRELSEAGRLDPDDPLRHTQLGTMLWNTGKCRDAVLGKANEQDPKLILDMAQKDGRSLAKPLHHPQLIDMFLHKVF
jgi:hypothetical protein